MLMFMINFKRKKDGKDGAWGVGLDYLLKDYWDDLDKVVEDNYYGRHDVKLINFLFPKVSLALKKSISDMKKFSNWVRKARSIQKFGALAKSINEKVVFIDAVTQFLRETSMKDRPDRIVKKRNANYKIKKFKGIMAGKIAKEINGVVRIVLDERDFSKFKKGEILVTDETDASFLPLMKKARAFITDDGGILCHAAIVAREMKKPCVVGTKVASRVLKTGDKVKISIDGTVKILLH